MGGLELWLELLLTALLAATLVHAIRLHRAIKALRGEREGLGDAVAGFDSGARRAEACIGRLGDAQIRLTGNMADAAALKDDLVFMTERATQAADRLEALVRSTRGLELEAASRMSSAPVSHHLPAAGTQSTVRSQAERDLLLALQGAR